MFVHPDFRRGGVNNLILDDLYRWTLSRGVTDLMLEVYPDNTGAVRAYEKAGFSPYLLQMHASLGIRTPQESELDHLAKIWYDGWQDAHADILPQELKDDRTFESFRERLPALFADTRVIGPVGRPVCKLDLGSQGAAGVVLEGVFTVREARGAGLAAGIVATVGHDEGRALPQISLHVGSDNEPARRAYERAGLVALDRCMLLLRG